MLILPGSNALSAFRSQRLLNQLQAVLPDVVSVQARYLHFIDAVSLSDDDTRRLQGLLTYGEPAHAEHHDSPVEEFVVIPRFGTISAPFRRGHPKPPISCTTAAWRTSTASNAALPSAST
jgi:phosphoribosylformylglycinamidine synthase